MGLYIECEWIQKGPCDLWSEFNLCLSFTFTDVSVHTDLLVYWFAIWFSVFPLPMCLFDYLIVGDFFMKKVWFQSLFFVDAAKVCRGICLPPIVALGDSQTPGTSLTKMFLDVYLNQII